MKIYAVWIQDGENEYRTHLEELPKLEIIRGEYEDVNEDLVDNFTRVIKEVEEYEATEEELKTLKKFGVI